MPFGLTNTPAIFQVLVNNVLWDFLNLFVFIYLGDILVYSKHIKQYTHHARSVLQRLHENQLFVKAEKFEFHIASLSFLGIIFEGGQFWTDPQQEKDSGKMAISWESKAAAIFPRIYQFLQEVH